MSDTRELLRRGLGDYEPRPDGYEQVLRRRERKQRNRRVGAAVVAIAIAAVLTAAFLNAFRQAKIPATPPSGWIVFSAPYVGTPQKGVVVDRGVKSDLFVVRPGDTASLVVGHPDDHIDQFCPAIDPGGTRLASLEQIGGSMNLDVADLGPDGSVGQPIISVAIRPGSLNPCPEWSPSGDELAVIDGSDVAIVDANGHVRYPDRRAVQAVTEVAWSPDGTMLALREGSIVDVIRAGDGRSVAITRGLHAADVGQLAWLSPTSLAIGTAEPQHGGQPSRVNADISIFDVLQQRVVQDVPIGPYGWVDDVTPLSDGRLLYTDSRSVLFAVDPITDSRTRLLGGLGWKPTLSPDGRWVAYLSIAHDDSGYALFALSLEDGTTVQLTPWSPGMEYASVDW